MPTVLAKESATQDRYLVVSVYPNLVLRELVLLAGSCDSCRLSGPLDAYWS